MRLAVIGTGHVGLPTAAVLAHIGHTVLATDSDKDKIDGLRRCEVPFFEDGLESLVREGLDIGRLHFSDDAGAISADVEAIFVCVGTPPTESGEANLVAVEQAVETIAHHARPGTVVVHKSTVPAGTGQRVQAVLHRQGVDLPVASNPEFLREGNAVGDSLRPTRILIGTDSPRALEIMRAIYAPLTDAGVPLIATDLATAELAKHACNAFLSLKISFANALARLADLSGADVVAVADVMGSDPRIGRAFLDAGLGYGGYCFPKDLAAFDRLANRLGYDFPLLREVARINDEAVDAIFDHISDALWNIEGKRVALLGLAFKPGTDDIRFSPAVALARKLHDAGARLVGFDPRARESVASEMPSLEIVDDVYSALKEADCAVVCTEWPEFTALDLPRVYKEMARPLIVDGRNVFDPQVMADIGFTYVPTGRPAVGPA